MAFPKQINYQLSLITKNGKNSVAQQIYKKSVANFDREEQIFKSIFGIYKNAEIIIVRTNNKKKTKKDRQIKEVISKIQPDLIQNNLGENIYWKVGINKNYVRASYKNIFKINNEIPNEQIGLRDPQVGAIYSVLSRNTVDEKISTVVMPTGTGKTEVMLSLFVQDSKIEKLLVVVPSDSLRTQITDKFKTLGKLEDLGCFTTNSFKYPSVGIMKAGIKNVSIAKNFVDSCNVIIATPQTLDRLKDEVREMFYQPFSHIFLMRLIMYQQVAGWKLEIILNISTLSNLLPPHLEVMVNRSLVK